MSDGRVELGIGTGWAPLNRLHSHGAHSLAMAISASG